MTIDDENVYVVDRGIVDSDCPGGSGSIWAVRKSGGELTLLADTLTCPFQIAADASGVYWSLTPMVGASAQTVSGAIERLPR
jgi:hypothetical protein